MRLFQHRCVHCVGLLLLSFGLAACPERKAIWVTSSEEGTPVFMLGTREGKPMDVWVDILWVDQCSAVDRATGEPREGRTMWAIVPQGDSAGTLRRVEYGVTPSGYSEVSQKRPLSAGCYVVTASADAVAEFTIDYQGEVSPLTREQL